MKDETRQALIALGMGMDQTLARFVGNEGLLFKFLRRFLDDASFSQLETAIHENNMEEAFRAAHTLKGVSGNLGLGSLFDACSPLVESLRQNQVEEASMFFDAVAGHYRFAIDTIKAIEKNP